jgi:hypothetical protein
MLSGVDPPQHDKSKLSANRGASVNQGVKLTQAFDGEMTAPI